MKRVDRIDEKIIELYQKDARMTNKAVAMELGIAPSTALERTRRLEEIGVFRGFHADVEPKHLGVRLLAMISVRLSKHDPHAVFRFTNHVLSLREVRDIYHVAGENDFLIHVVVRDSEHLRRVVLEGITAQVEVEHVETNLIFDHHRDHVLESSWDIDQ
ncbi:MAG: Lrp/AsnC family transcriptional regulator [Bacteroidota bacterium]|nr:Lrp/AsnC family transcriptional regulator [Bacteroidota bacterium]